MELSPEEYGAYWRASLRLTAGVLVFVVAVLVSRPLLSHPEPGATALGVVLFVALVLAASYLVVLGLARTVRVAVGAERRR